jgi:1-deoxy-D-xylulose-5-phosphate synthase
MAIGGMRPIVAIYSTFLNRAWDQVVYDVALHRLPVVFCIDRAGVTGPDGPSHHGVYDMALLARVPGMRVLAPSSAQELHQMLHDATSLADGGPVAIRYARGQARNVGEHDVGLGIRARRTRTAPGDPADAICVLAVGKLVEGAERAADTLGAAGIPVTVWDVRCCAPLDADMLADAAAHRAIVTCEDGIRDGGVGMAIEDAIGDLRADIPVEVLGLPTRFLPHDGRPERILAQLGLDADGISAVVRRFV